jgi:hypothetical protein
MRHAIALIAVMPRSLAAGSDLHSKENPRRKVGGWLHAQRHGLPRLSASTSAMR